MKNLPSNSKRETTLYSKVFELPNQCAVSEVSENPYGTLQWICVQYICISECILHRDSESVNISSATFPHNDEQEKKRKKNRNEILGYTFLLH